jgi:predicted DsbA family dithiol-disulfide isomerase
MMPKPGDNTFPDGGNMSKARRKQAAIEKAQHERMRHVMAVAAVLVVIAVAMTAAYLGMQSSTSPPGDEARQAALASSQAPTLGDPGARVHSGAEYAVRVLEASRKQDKYWETLEALLMSQRQWVTNHVVQPDKVLPAIAQVGLDEDQLMADMRAPEVSQRIEQDKQDAVALKVSATPEYFVNGRPLPSFGQQQLLDLVREELQKAY